MKRWHKRSIIILALGVAGVAALGLRPGVEPPQAASLLPRAHAETTLPAYYKTGRLHVVYRWQLQAPPPNTVLRGVPHENVFDRIAPTECQITIRAQDGKLTADYTTPPLHTTNGAHTTNTQYHAYFSAPVHYYLPNGSTSLKYYLYLHCQSTLTPPFWQAPMCTAAVQTLCIDVAQGTVDLVEPAHIAENATCRIVRTGPTPDLPARFCGTPREQALQRLLYDFADACRTPSGKKFRTFVQQAHSTVQQHTTPHKAWPHCWEEASAEASRANKLIESTVRELHQHNYYGSDALKNFILSPCFVRIFGDTFEQAVDANPVDAFGTGTEGIIFEEWDAEHFSDSSDPNDKK